MDDWRNLEAGKLVQASSAVAGYCAGACHLDKARRAGALFTIRRGCALVVLAIPWLYKRIHSRCTSVDARAKRSSALPMNLGTPATQPTEDLRMAGVP